MAAQDNGRLQGRWQLDNLVDGAWQSESLTLQPGGTYSYSGMVSQGEDCVASLVFTGSYSLEGNLIHLRPSSGTSGCPGALRPLHAGELGQALDVVGNRSSLYTLEGDSLCFARPRRGPTCFTRGR